MKENVAFSLFKEKHKPWTKALIKEKSRLLHLFWRKMMLWLGLIKIGFDYRDEQDFDLVYRVKRG